jgi:hypothetical protein
MAGQRPRRLAPEIAAEVIQAVCPWLLVAMVLVWIASDARHRGPVVWTLCVSEAVWLLAMQSHIRRGNRRCVLTLVF